MSARPGINEYDTGSYLDGSLMEHDVIHRSVAGFRVDGAPSFRHKSIAGWGARCRACSYAAAKELGYTGPETLMVSYQPGMPLEPEEVLVWRQGGEILGIASYGYGRAYFEPGEPRTAPCEVCGTETLVDA